MRSFAGKCLALWVCCAASGLAQTNASASATVASEPVYLSNPKFQKAVAKAKSPHQPLEDQMDAWKRANKIAGNLCVECLHQLVALDLKRGEYKDAAAAAAELDAATSIKEEAFFARAERGMALLALNEDKPKPDQLTVALDSFKAALALAPKANGVVYAEGRVLALMGRDEEARAAFVSYVAATPVTDKYHLRAEHFVEDTHAAAMRMAPPFALKTQTGEAISLDDMRGKVVLLDFWATWCGPCKETLPEVQRIAQEFAGQPMVVLSISIDRDAEAWSKFIEKNHMDWPQYRDGDGALSSIYGAQSIPRFFTIDTNGVLQSVQVGSGASIEPALRKLVNRARDAEKKRVHDAEKATGQ